jgi:hypothetical protein
MGALPKVLYNTLMIINQKLQKRLIFAYALLLSVSFIYVRTVLATDKIAVDEKRPREKIVEVKPVKVRLIVDTGRSVTSYERKIKPDVSVMDLIDDVRVSEGLYYQRTDYVRGIVIDEVNGIMSRDGFSWRIFKGTEDITLNADNIDVGETEEFSLRYVRTE